MDKWLPGVCVVCAKCTKVRQVDFLERTMGACGDCARVAEARDFEHRSLASVRTVVSQKQLEPKLAREPQPKSRYLIGL